MRAPSGTLQTVISVGLPAIPLPTAKYFPEGAIAMAVTLGTVIWLIMG